MRYLILLAGLMVFTLASASRLHANDALAFPGAQGFAAATPGGRGGKILKVTTLQPAGPGSLSDALAAEGPRIIVFEVGGVIDLGGKSLSIRQPYVTVAGQTAPAPGVTLIKGGLSISSHDVIVRHLAIRPGSMGRALKSGWEVDGIGLSGASRVVIDHCSCTWATDENLSVSGERFKGAGPGDWWKNTSHDVTISNCLIAEGLSHSTHGKGEHSKGSLLHDNTRRVSLIGNLYASNMERNPLMKGGAQAVIVNNWISNPGRHAIHVALVEQEWREHKRQTALVTVVGNVLEAGPDTSLDAALFKRHGQTPVKWYLEDNEAWNLERQPADLTRDFEAPPQKTPPLWPEHLHALPASKVKAFVAKNAGARPWDRDSVDERIVQAALAGEGKIIDSEEQSGGYPERPATTAPFDEAKWNLETMEPRL